MKKLVLCSILLLLPIAASADEGMWMPQQIPALGDELVRRGLKLDPAVFADLTGFPMGAIVHLGNCSASFVSPEGLLATNHHCVQGALQYNSTPENDLLTKGFVARSRAQEIQALPDARVYVTTAIEDVTPQILSKLPASLPDAQRLQTITRRRRDIVAECEKPGGLRCLVSSYFGGGQYLKLTQMEIRDVRLVYAPALGVGNFGDETDNWMWPRHTGDFALYRAYVNRDGRPADHSPDNVPYKPARVLKISTRDLDPGDLVFTIGFPGVTNRHETAAEVRDAQEFLLPLSLKYRGALVDILSEQSKKSRAIAIRNASRIASFENYLKKHRGTLEAFRRSDILALKEKQERELRDAAAADTTLQRAYTVANSELQRILTEKRRTREHDQLYTWLYTSSPMLTQADHLYRLSVEKTKADRDRAEVYMDRERNKLRATLARTRRSIEPVTDRAGLQFMLLEAAHLPRDQRITPIDERLAATGKEGVDEQVEALLDAIYASTSIGDAAAEETMFAASTETLLARRDSMIDFAAALRKTGNEIDSRNAAFEGALSRTRPAILSVLRAARGGKLYPDANGTLRVGFGTVDGYSPRDAVRYTAQTDVSGILEKDTGIRPFDSPAQLLDHARKGQFGQYADPELQSLPVGFASTNVVTNGSSGSATLNAWGELCGLAFDSNWEGVGSDFLVESDITRTVHVDSRYMLWVMDAVDGAFDLLRELGVTPSFEP